MACMTLKRTLDFDPVHNPDQRTPKRRKFMHLSSHTRYGGTSPCSSNSHSQRSIEKRSLFTELSAKLTPEQVAEHVREEMRRLVKRKQLAYPSSNSNQSSQSENEDSISPPSSPSATTSDGVSNSKRDQPLFTFRQVGIICERLLKEQETHIRDEYDKVLTSKLAEQYDTFVKFTHDQIQRRFEGATASYLS